MNVFDNKMLTLISKSFLLAYVLSYHRKLLKYEEFRFISEKHDAFCLLFRLLASISVCICSTVAILTWICVSWEKDDPKVTPVEVFDPKHPPLVNLLKGKKCTCLGKYF